jgi:predicted metal-binding membrane protein
MANRYCRRRCSANVRSGFEFGRYCVRLDLALMVIWLALGVMSVTWMAVVAVLVVAHRSCCHRLPGSRRPVAIAIVALGIVAAVAPSSIPGLTPVTKREEVEE